MAKRLKVVTYQLAYATGEEVSLCSAHEHDTRFGVAGQVQHGARAGECDVCEDEARLDAAGILTR